MTAQFENSKAVMVTHYQGLTMPELDELRALSSFCKFSQTSVCSGISPNNCLDLLSFWQAEQVTTGINIDNTFEYFHQMFLQFQNILHSQSLWFFRLT